MPPAGGLLCDGAGEGSGMTTRQDTMTALFAPRMQNVQKSFIREILKVTERPEVISFAGGLPNPSFFPVQPLAEACAKVLADHGAAALQYRTTEGLLPLREWIADRYRARLGLEVSPEEILITTGAQQGLDLIGKVFLDKGDGVVLERPGYLGAIQAFGIYEARFLPVPLYDDGLDIEALESALAQEHVKLLYSVPNFQNPSGVSYSAERRRSVAALCRKWGKVLVEDDPYGELRFRGSHVPPIATFLDDGAILLGTFSKIVSPGLRLGWICAPRPVMERLVVAKQATDLHSGGLSQHVLHQYLQQCDFEAHIALIREAYGRQCDLMLSALDAHCPEQVRYTRPEGGMFLWMELPPRTSSLRLFERALQEDVAFVPGRPFYVDGGGEDTLRLSFATADGPTITEGIARLGRAMSDLLATRPLPGANEG
jgi:2-aminoadipate transaminase